MVKLIIQNYKIVDKKETRVLKRCLDECRNIYKAWNVLSEKGQEKTESVLDDEINMKLEKCFRFYNKKYGVEIEYGYGEMNDIDINISNICEKIRSWEE